MAMRRVVSLLVNCILCAEGLSIRASTPNRLGSKIILHGEKVARRDVFLLGPAVTSYFSNVRSSTAQPQEFKNVGTQAPPPDGEAPFTNLDSGVKFKDFKTGNGLAVKAGSKISVQCSGRLLNLNGVYFFNTKSDNVLLNFSEFNL